jgi:DNA-binding transcriptional LysR family regulator
MAETLDITLLRTFVAIDECGGFGRAASALQMSQSTVSQHVRSLERRLGQPLVERDGRHAKLTLAGEQLLVEARRIIAVHDEALARLDVTTPRTIVIGSTEMAAGQILPELLEKMRGVYPDRQMQFVIDRSTQMTDAVAKGTIDLAIVLDTGQSIPGIEVGTLPLHWYASASWAPPAPGRPLPLVAYTEPCGMRQRALRELGDDHRRVEIAAESGSLEGVIAAARAGLGLAVLPSFGRAPVGLVVRRDFPDLGQIFVRLVARRGIEDDVVTTAVRAMEDFFSVTRFVHAFSA